MPASLQVQPGVGQGLPGQHLNRKREHQSLLEAGDETLKGTKYLWLYAAENLPEQLTQQWRRLRTEATAGVRAARPCLIWKKSDCGPPLNELRERDGNSLASRPFIYNN